MSQTAAQSVTIKASKIPAQLQPSMEEMLALVAPFNAGQFQECIKDCEQFIQKYPKHYFGYKLLGACHEQLNEWIPAAKHMEHSLRLQPKDIEGLGNLAKVYKDIGKRKEAIELYERALSLNPNDPNVLAKYLFALNYADIATPEQTLSLAKQLGQLISNAATTHYQKWHIHNSLPIRVGLVSGDLNMHPVGFFLEYVLAHLNPTELHITAYPTREANDHVTERIKKHIQQWTSIAKLTDAEAAKRIHEDKIDVLIDLSGLTAYHRLGVFAHKPAPVQISWLGYFATTGLPQMDYLLADQESIGRAQETHFSEKIIRMPHTRLCYGATHLSKVSETSSLPALGTTPSKITLGCYQNVSKITDEVLHTWSRILTALPHAQLRIQNKQFASADIQTLFKNRCIQQGIDINRVSIHSPSGLTSYMNSYAEVDFLLDTFPFPGGTTTCEALWMGIPTLTLRGEHMISRQGAALLHAAGLDEWIADTTDEYEQKAIHFAQNIAALAQLRAGLRERVRVSPLFDASRFAQDFTRLIMQTYRQHIMQLMGISVKITKKPNRPQST